MTFLEGLTGWFAVNAVLNFLIIPRPRIDPDAVANLVILIPARNEAANLTRLVPTLRAQGLEVWVFDDESDDGTGEIAARGGARVLTPAEPLPEGWTGKNRALHALGQAALASSTHEWFVFLDADVSPTPRFAMGLRTILSQTRAPVVSGIPRVIPGEGFEPLFMAWIGWIILATDPFWIVRLTGLGHSRFLNGQIHAWRQDTYARLDPWSELRGRVMEDVSAARLCARRRVPIDVLNLSGLLSVRMYRTWRETLDGFSKNAYEITGSGVGTALLALLLFGLAIAPLGSPWCAVALVISGLATAATARAPLWPAFWPIPALLIGVATLIRSWRWRKTGRVTWKGRTYAPK